MALLLLEGARAGDGWPLPTVRMFRSDKMERPFLLMQPVNQTTRTGCIPYMGWFMKEVSCLSKGAWLGIKKGAHGEDPRD